jgi:hypothetical protein
MLFLAAMTIICIVAMVTGHTEIALRLLELVAHAIDDGIGFTVEFRLFGLDT